MLSAMPTLGGPPGHSTGGAPTGFPGRRSGDGIPDDEGERD